MAQVISQAETMPMIRRLQAADAPALRVLYEKLVASTFEALPPAARSAYLLDWTVEIIAARAKEPQRVLLGLFENSRIRGYLLGTPPEGGVATIIWLAIEPAFHGRGFGRDLMTTAFAAYKELGSHKVKLFTNTREALNFYERIGMTREGFHPRHWWDVDYWSLAKHLKQ